MRKTFLEIHRRIDLNRLNTLSQMTAEKLFLNSRQLNRDDENRLTAAQSIGWGEGQGKGFVQLNSAGHEGA